MVVFIDRDFVRERERERLSQGKQCQGKRVRSSAQAAHKQPEAKTSRKRRFDFNFAVLVPLFKCFCYLEFSFLTGAILNLSLFHQLLWHDTYIFHCTPEYHTHTFFCNRRFTKSTALSTNLPVYWGFFYTAAWATRPPWNLTLLPRDRAGRGSPPGFLMTTAIVSAFSARMISICSTISAVVIYLSRQNLPLHRHRCPPLLSSPSLSRSQGSPASLIASNQPVNTTDSHAPNCTYPGCEL